MDTQYGRLAFPEAALLGLGVSPRNFTKVQEAYYESTLRPCFPEQAIIDDVATADFAATLDPYRVAFRQHLTRFYSRFLTDPALKPAMLRVHEGTSKPKFMGKSCIRFLSMETLVELLEWSSRPLGPLPPVKERQQFSAGLVIPKEFLLGFPQQRSCLSQYAQSLDGALDALGMGRPIEHLPPGMDGRLYMSFAQGYVNTMGRNKKGSSLVALHNIFLLASIIQNLMSARYDPDGEPIITLSAQPNSDDKLIMRNYLAPVHLFLISPVLALCMSPLDERPYSQNKWVADVLTMKLARQQPQNAVLVLAEHAIARLVFSLVAAPPLLQTSPSKVLQHYFPSLCDRWLELRESLPPLEGESECAGKAKGKKLDEDLMEEEEVEGMIEDAEER